MKLRLRLFLICFLILQIPILITNIPFLKYRLPALPGTVSNLVHGGHVDYFSYLTFIREAKAGAWKVPGMYTSEPSVSSYIYVFYIGVGKLAALTGVSPIAAYHLARIFSVELFAAAFILLVMELMPLCLIVPSVLVGAFSTTPLQLFGLQIWEYSDAWRWWYNLDPLFRFDYVPHHHFGIAMMSLALLFFLRYVKNKRPLMLLAAVVSTFACALVYPTPALVMLIGLPLVTVWHEAVTFVRSKKISHTIPLGTFTVCVAGGIGLLLIYMETQRGFPWSQWNVWDIVHWNLYPKFNRDFLAAGGFALLLAVPTMIRIVIRKSTFPEKMLVVWAILPYILLGLADPLHMAKIRLGFLANFVPLGILAVHTVNSAVSIRTKSPVRNLLLSLFIIFFIVVSAQTTLCYYRDKEGFNRYNALHIRTPLPMVQAFGHLATHAENYPVVLADGEASIMLPAFAPVKTYSGHPVHTKDFDAKAYAVSRFFQGNLTVEEVAGLLASGNISYILVGPQEISQGGNIRKYGLPLTEWYVRDNVVIYKLNK